MMRIIVDGSLSTPAKTPPGLKTRCASVNIREYGIDLKAFDLVYTISQPIRGRPGARTNFHRGMDGAGHTGRSVANLPIRLFRDRGARPESDGVCSKQRAHRRIDGL